jgi:hypothetical protein
MCDEGQISVEARPIIELDSDLIAGSKITKGGKRIYPSVGEPATIGTDCGGLASIGELENLRPQFEEAVELTRVRIGTLLRADNVSLLLAAGCSLQCNGVSLSRIPISLEKAVAEAGVNKDGKPEEWLNLFYESVGIILGQNHLDTVTRVEELGRGTAEAIDLGFERLLCSLHTWAEAARQGIALTTPGGNGVSSTPMETLIDQLTRALAKACDLGQPGNPSYLQSHRDLITKLLTRPLNLRRVSLFALNYDTLLEQAMDAEGVVAVDGFVGTMRRIFRPESYDQDLYFPAQTTEGHVHRLSRVAHLYKLHGSVNWHMTEPTWENPYGLYSTFYDEEAADPVVVYPTPLKYGQTLGLPYSELFRRFATNIVQTQSVLFVIGYAFGDDHVNAIIRQALAVPSFTLVIVDPNPQSEFVKTLAQQKDERVWMITGELGKFKEFVQHLLPDLREEDIERKVVETYRALKPTHPTAHSDKGGDDGAK